MNLPSGLRGACKPGDLGSIPSWVKIILQKQMVKIINYNYSSTKYEKDKITAK